MPGTQVSVCNVLHVYIKKTTAGSMWDFSINYLATGNLHTGLPREMQVFLIAIMILLGGITTTRAGE